jgi:hypothetical protein
MRTAIRVLVRRGRAMRVLVGKIAAATAAAAIVVVIIIVVVATVIVVAIGTIVTVAHTTAQRVVGSPAMQAVDTVEGADPPAVVGTTRLYGSAETVE